MTRTKSRVLVGTIALLSVLLAVCAGDPEVSNEKTRPQTPRGAHNGLHTEDAPPDDVGWDDAPMTTCSEREPSKLSRSSMVFKS